MPKAEKSERDRSNSWFSSFCAKNLFLPFHFVVPRFLNLGKTENKAQISEQSRVLSKRSTEVFNFVTVATSQPAAVSAQAKKESEVPKRNCKTQGQIFLGMLEQNRIHKTLPPLNEST